MTDSVNGPTPIDEDDVFENSSEEFAGKEDMLNRLVAIYPTGEKGRFAPKADGKPGDPWYGSITVVLDDGPNGWQETVVGKNGEIRGNLIPSVAEEGPQAVPYRWSTKGAVTRLAAKLPELHDGVPHALIGRIDKGQAKGGNNAPWRPNPASAADLELVVQPEMKAARLKARDEIIAALKSAEVEDAF